MASAIFLNKFTLASQVDPTASPQLKRTRQSSWNPKPKRKQRDATA